MQKQHFVTMIHNCLNTNALRSITYSGGPTAEWDMEKMRYYVELPGDLYEDGYFMDLVKVNMAPLRDEHGRVDHNDLLLADQTYLELQVIDHSDA